MRRSSALSAVSIALLAACAAPPPPRPPAYKPQARYVTVTTVALMVKEDAGVLPFLKKDFAKGGVLDGKEVYGFEPSTITVVAGDTIHFHFVNPEDDEHNFVLRDLFVKLPGQQVVDTTYVSRAPGIYDFACAIPAHLPMMHGQLVVLAPSAVAGTAQ
ncbi:MAG: cupredoxin domain-containing protein [Gemmatimonadota bacterium]|nr:cupredoxin domain-containing protein [Gemmatimonadota bacterium]